jgi:hypothetical protein
MRQARLAYNRGMTSVDELSADEREDFEERAAIREFAGRQSREEAEREALAEVARARVNAWLRKGPRRAPATATPAARRSIKP